MNRRFFLGALSTQGVMLSGLSPLMALGGESRTSILGTIPNSTGITKIGEWSLQDIRDIFYKEFYTNNLPIWRNHVVDWQYGGYIPHIRPYVDQSGNLKFTDKRLYHQARCFWLYSYLYNHVEKDPFYLEAAKKGYDFLLKYGYEEKTSLWREWVTREGKELVPPRDIFASIYMFLALGEYYKASGDEEVADLASISAHAILKTVSSNHFQAPGMGPRSEQYDSYREPGTRRLGIWMHFLSALTPYLTYKEDPAIEMISNFCVRNLLERHYDREKRFAYEFLQFDYTPYPKSYHTHETLRVADGFHSVETSWMCMDEALRRGNQEMYLDALHLGKDVMEMLWLERDGKQGLVRYYWPDDKDPMERAEILSPYVMNEVWVMLLLGMEHTSETWLVDWFDRSFTYSYKTGKLNFPYGETLHHPRGLLFGIQILDRMIARDGQPSDFLEPSNEPQTKPHYR